MQAIFTKASAEEGSVLVVLAQFSRLAHLETLKVHEQPDQQSPGSCPVLNASRVHHHGQQQPHCV